MSVGATMLLLGGAALGVMAIAYLAALRHHHIGIVDLGWSLGLAVAALVALLVTKDAGARAYMVAALVTLWALRLSWHVWRHRVFRKEEDARYAALREHWGARAKTWIPVLFLAEAPLIPLFALPAVIAMRQPAAGVTVWDVLGVVIWVVAVAGETIADQQLERFRSQAANRGKTCRDGLWRYSRHPNYFFEWFHWWAYVALAIGTPLMALTLAGPALMFIFLYKITGIPHAERRALQSRGEDYRRYQRETNAFFPWFPREEQAS